MGKNGLITYFSWIGNTKVIAEEIHVSTGYDLIRIDELKERKKGNIMGAAMSALFGLSSSIKSMDFSFSNYDNIFLGTPVWAGKTPPAINKFLKKASLKGKKIWLFITMGDDKIPQKTIELITSRIENKGGEVVDCLYLTTKWDPKTNIPMKPEDFGTSVQDWVEKININ